MPYFCPDFSEDGIDLLIENSYTNTSLRKSFSMEILTCSLDRNPNCKSREEVDKFLHAFRFTQYVLI